MSPRFVGKENVMANANRQHTEFAILNSLPKEDLVELVINTRRQLKHYARALEEKEVRVGGVEEGVSGYG
jgi:predicted hydrolase (HD superfamily)